MGRIRRMPSALANQIAAGEVVERPASIVKELVENALDAGATRVRVEIDQGGTARARVIDDGSGMDPDDAALAFERHATSKIVDKDDLFRLTTFGFRGEALPSIASVARLKLLTRTRGAAEGTEVTVEGGGPVQARPAGAAEGTSVDVSDLFFNVPARRKFLKATGTEAAHVGEVLLQCALARPEVSFFLARDGRTAREWLRMGTRRERVAQALDGEQLEACTGERGPMRIEAHLGAPERARAGAVALHLFINGRPVRDRQLARAVAQAYGSVLEPGRYPVGVVYIDIPSQELDVNVHPQKAEVRFADARAVFGAVTRELHHALARAFALPALGAPRAWTAPPQGAPASIAEPTSPWTTPPLHLSPPPPNAVSATPLERATLPSGAAPDPLQPEPPPASLFRGVGFYTSLEFLAQVRATFLVCAGSDGLYVLDQHAAAERVTFHRLRTAFASRTVEMQRLLIPEVIDLVSAEVATIEEHADEIAALGVELRAVGPNAVAVHGVPTLIKRRSAERIVRDIVAELGRNAKRPFGDAADLVLATMACHGSVRAGDMLSREEVAALLRALDGVDFAGHCPHGRPVVTRIAFDELERRVGR
jgi:DNA mismatch repair protein MutL